MNCQQPLAVGIKNDVLMFDMVNVKADVTMQLVATLVAQYEEAYQRYRQHLRAQYGV